MPKIRKTQGAVDSKWFKDRLADMGMTAKRLGDLTGVKETDISKRIAGKVAFQASELPMLARVLGVDLAEIYRRAGFQVPRESKAMVPIVGAVNAAWEVVRLPREAPHRVDRPSLDGADISALLVLAPGMNGWTAFYRPTVRREPAAVGRLSVVQVLGGRRYMRVLQQGFDRTSWALTSLDGAVVSDGLQLEWAAPVVWLRT